MDDVGSKWPQRPINDITRDIHGLHTRPSGCGGQSDVYCAFWSNEYGYLPVAVKVLRFAGDPDERIRKRLDSEISLWERVSHPNLQRLLGLCCVPTSALPAMVSEWHPNGDVTSYLKTKAQDPELQEIKYRCLIEVLEGVEYLHENDILHGDIKGANVLISNDGSARLSDFGFSIISTEHSRSLSQRSAAKGTTRWMAPEFFDENDRVARHTRASDVWAIGCLIIEVQIGDLPYGTKRSDPAVILAIVKGEPPALQPFDPDALWQLMLNCCQAEPSARYATSRVLSGLRIERLRAHLHRGHHSGSLLCCDRAILDLIDHLRDCKASRSPIAPSVGKVLRMRAFTTSVVDQLGVRSSSLTDPAYDLLAVCVHVAQEPPSDISIDFLVNTVPPLLSIVKRSKGYFTASPRYPADVIRPLAQILAKHGDASVASILMRFCATAPGSFNLTVGWDLRSNRQASTAWSRDGKTFAVAEDNLITITHPGKPSSIPLTMGQSSVARIALSPDGQRLAYSCVFGATVTLSLWDIPSNSPLDIGTTPANIGATQELVFDHDGVCFASVNQAAVYVWRVGQTPTHVPTLHSCVLTTIAFTADSRIVVGGFGDPEWPFNVVLSVHDIDTTALVTSLDFDIAVPACQKSTLDHQGRYLLAWSFASDTLCLYSPASGRLVCSLQVEEESVITCVASSPDGSHTAAGTFDGLVYVWDVQTETLLDNSPFRVHRGTINRLTFTSDGSKIVTSMLNGEICISDIRGSWLRWDI